MSHLMCLFPKKASFSLLLAGIFFLYALLQIVFLATVTPPFQVADEVNHFCRAFQVSEGDLIGKQPGFVDPAIRDLAGIYQDIPFNPKKTTTKQREWLSEKIEWSSERIGAIFPNTAAYTPLHYLPQAFGLILGRVLRLNIRDSLVLSRISTGVFAVILCSLSIYICRRGRYLLFTVLLFPMALSLYASINQDGVIIPVMAFAVALLSRILSAGRPATGKELALLAAAILLVILGRPPYAPFALVFLLPGLIKHRRPKLVGIVLIAGIGALALLWIAPMALGQASSYDTSKDPKLQMQFFMQAMGNDIWFFPKLLVKTFQIKALAYGRGVVGHLGWLDTHMPPVYYLLACGVFALAFLAELLGKQPPDAAEVNSRTSAYQKILLFLISASALLLLFFIEYFLGTVVGGETINGVQGRYLIPIGLLFFLCLPQVYHQIVIRRICIVCVLLFPYCVTSVYLPLTIIGRYYTA